MSPLTLIALLQAPPAGAATDIGPRIDLSRAIRGEPCRSSNAEEVVVCGERRGESPYRLRQVFLPAGMAEDDPLTVKLPGGAVVKPERIDTWRGTFVGVKLKLPF